MIIKPTVGRVVWFWDRNAAVGSQPQAAFIVYVHSDTMVNLAILGAQANAAPDDVRSPLGISFDAAPDYVRSEHPGIRFGSSGTAVIYGLSSVYLRQDGPRPVFGDFCEWMPYQIGQAAKHAEPPEPLTAA